MNKRRNHVWATPTSDLLLGREGGNRLKGRTGTAWSEPQAPELTWGTLQQQTLWFSASVKSGSQGHTQGCPKNQQAYK